jgi:hypothetical protein
MRKPYQPVRLRRMLLRRHKPRKEQHFLLLGQPSLRRKRPPLRPPDARTHHHPLQDLFFPTLSSMSHPFDFKRLLQTTSSAGGTRLVNAFKPPKCWWHMKRRTVAVGFPRTTVGTPPGVTRSCHKGRSLRPTSAETARGGGRRTRFEGVDRGGGSTSTSPRNGDA